LQVVEGFHGDDDERGPVTAATRVFPDFGPPAAGTASMRDAAAAFQGLARLQILPFDMPTDEADRRRFTKFPAHDSNPMADRNLLVLSAARRLPKR
jgi:hypothetical protein